MARAAVEAATCVADATGAMDTGHKYIRLKEVKWGQPVTVEEEPVQIHIGIYPGENGEIGYEIYSEPVYREPGMEDTAIVHSQGNARLNTETETPVLNLSKLQMECNQRVLTREEIYETFKGLGLEYGPSYQRIEEIYVGAERALVKLALPENEEELQEKYGLYPGLLESCLSATVCLMKGAGKLIAPNAVQEIEIWGKGSPVKWCVIGSSESSHLMDKAPQFDIDFCDEAGNVRVRMKGYTVRELEIESNMAVIPETLETILVEESWQEQAPAVKAALEYTQQLVILCELGEVSETIAAQLAGVRCLRLESKQKGIDKRYRLYVTQVFEEIQNIFKNQYTERVFIQIVIPGQGEARVIAGLSGLLKTARLENPKLAGQLIEIEPGMDGKEIAAKLQESSRSPEEKEIRYQEGKRWVAGFREFDAFTRREQRS